MHHSVLTIEASLPLGITLPEYRRTRRAADARRSLLRRLAGAVAS